MTSSPYPVHVNLKISISTNQVMWYLKQLQTLIWVNFLSYLVVSVWLNRPKSYFSNFRNITKIHYGNLVTSLWRNRTWPDSEKSLALYKFCMDYDAKRIRSIALTSFEKQIQNCSSLKGSPSENPFDFWNQCRIRLSPTLNSDSH